MWNQRGLKKKSSWTVRQIAGEKETADPLMRQGKDPHLTCQAVTWSVIEKDTSRNNRTSWQITLRHKVTAKISIKCKKALLNVYVHRSMRDSHIYKTPEGEHNKRLSGCDYI